MKAVLIGFAIDVVDLAQLRLGLLRARMANAYVRAIVGGGPHPDAARTRASGKDWN